MFGSDRLFLALALVTTATTAAAGCGGGGETGSGGSTSSSSSTTTSSSTSSTTTSGSGSGVAYDPIDNNRPGGPLSWCSSSTVLAVQTLVFGEGDSGQWKSLGFNIDGLVTDGTSGAGLCQPAAGGSISVHANGNNGIDNSFGANILPLIISLDGTWPTDVNNAIGSGTFTALVELECLPPAGDVPAFTTKLFGGEALGMTPKWDGTDKWPVEPDLLADPTDPESSTISFPGCSVTGTTFNAGQNATFILTIPVTTQGMSTSLKLTLYAAQMTMTLAADRKSATGGMLGGVLNTSELIDQIKKVGYLLDLCSALPNILTHVEQASDIMVDGTQDPTQTCNGISMGLGFTMQQAQIGVVGPAAPMGMSCP
jgi:hypothetical protein